MERMVEIRMSTVHRDGRRQYLLKKINIAIFNITIPQAAKYLHLNMNRTVLRFVWLHVIEPTASAVAVHREDVDVVPAPEKCGLQ